MTQRELDEIYKRETRLGGWQNPNLVFAVVICFTYACISPIILPFGVMFFFFSLVVFKKQVLLVYVADHESGGTMFPSTCFVINKFPIKFTCNRLFDLTTHYYYFNPASFMIPSPPSL